MARRFIDHAGWLHQGIAEQADAVVLMTAGLPQRLK
jgi:adenosylcobinamide kinase/adenosylcobinamide-phosphate guanylyltransferase